MFVRLLPSVRALWAGEANVYIRVDTFSYVFIRIHTCSCMWARPVSSMCVTLHRRVRARWAGESYVRLHIIDITFLCVTCYSWRDWDICVTHYVWFVCFICVTPPRSVRAFAHASHLCDKFHPCVWRISFISVTRVYVCDLVRAHMCDMSVTSDLWHVAFIRETLYVWYFSFIGATADVRHVSTIRVTLHLRLWAHVWHVSFTSVTCLTHKCDMSHS